MKQIDTPKVDQFRSQANQIWSELSANSIGAAVAARSLLDVAYQLERHRVTDLAHVIYRDTIAFLETCFDNGDGKLSARELGSVAFDHGRSLFQFGRFADAIASFRRSKELWESIITTNCADDTIEELATSLTWLALCQRKTGAYKESLASYEAAVVYWRQLVAYGQKPARFRRDALLGACLYGYAKNLKQLGQRSLAMEFLKESANHLQRSSDKKLRLFHQQ